MAVLELNALSTALSGSFSATVIFPENGKMEEGKLYPALYFLHDIGGDDTDIRTIKNLQALANELGLFVIAPSVMHSFGLDLPWGGKYGRFVHQELPGICRHMFPLDPKKQYVGGAGYGAYGAFLQAAEHPEVFSRCFTLNGKFDIPALCEAAARGEEIPHLTVPMLEAVFGDLKALRGSRFDVLAEGRKAPKDLFVSCQEDCPEYGHSAQLAKLNQTALHTGITEEDLFAAALRWL